MSRLEELKANPIVWSLLNKYKEHEHLIPALLRGEISQNSNRGKNAQWALHNMLLRDADLSRMPREARLEFFALFLPTKPSRVVINKKKVPAEIVRMRIAAWIYRYRLAHGKYDEAIEAAAAHHKIKWTRARDIWTELGGIAAVFVHTMNGEAVPKDDPSLEKSLQRYVTRIRSGRKK